MVLRTRNLIVSKYSYTTPPPPINFVHASYVPHRYNWSCSRSTRPPSLFGTRHDVPSPFLAAVLGPIACPSRSTRRSPEIV